MNQAQVVTNDLCCGWPEADYEAFLSQLQILQSQRINVDLVDQIAIILGGGLYGKINFVIAQKLQSTKFSDFVLGLDRKIVEKIKNFKPNSNEYLFWRICYLYTHAVNEMASWMFQLKRSEKDSAAL